MDGKNSLVQTIETFILGVHLILTASILSGSVIILFIKRLEFWPNVLATFFTSVIIYRVFYSKIFSNKTKISGKLVGIAMLTLLVLLGVTYMRVNYKMFNCAADLGWHIYYTFKIRQNYDLTELSSLLLPFQLSTFNYPGIYFFLNLFIPFNFSLDIIPTINFLFNLVNFVFYSLIGFTIALITVYIIQDIFAKQSLWAFFAAYMIYLFPDIPSDYILRGNLPDLVGFFYLYSSIYFIIVLLNTSIINLVKFTVISTLSSYFLHPYATLYFLIIDLFIFTYFFIKLHTKFFKTLFQVDLLLYSSVILFEIITVHPLSPLNVSKMLSMNDWAQYVLPLTPVSVQFSYLQFSKLRIMFDLFLSSSIILLFALLPFFKQIYRIKIYKVLILLYIPYYILYLSPIVGIQIEPNRYVWRSFDILPLFTLMITFFIFELINKRRIIFLFFLILVVIFTFAFLTYTKAIYTPNYASLNTCGSNPQVIYNITQTLRFLVNFSEYSIVIFASHVPYCTYFELLNLLNPAIKVYPLSSSAIYILRGDIQNNLKELYNKYINCQLFNNIIYIYTKDFDCSKCNNCIIYTNFNLKIVISDKT
jgi:hypothetical protein